MAKHPSGSEQHLTAAANYGQAALHHRLASQHYTEKDYARAAHQALMAHGHAQQAVCHANEAAKYHIEQHDKSPAPQSAGARLEPVR
jgi:hypothetical protein